MKYEERESAQRPLIQLENLVKVYDTGALKVLGLKKINLTIHRGEFVAVMGHSGSGKSTLMNILGCLDRPTLGHYYLDGVDTADMTPDQLSEIRNRKIGFVFQNFNLLPRQSVLENVALPLLYAGVRKKDRLVRAKEMLTRVGLEDRVNFKPTQLSGGQKQRVAIARAMVSHPRLLLADEPTGALDTRSGEQVMELFSQLNAEGVTIVMITHELEIAQHAQRIVTIRDGRLEQGGFGERRTEQEGDAS